MMYSGTKRQLYVYALQRGCRQLASYGTSMHTTTTTIAIQAKTSRTITAIVHR